MSTFGEWLERTARAVPDGVAVESVEGRLGYRELDERSSRLASALAALGAGRGDRVADVQGNGSRAVETIFGVARAGAVRVPVNPRLSRREVLNILLDSQPRVVILGAGHEDLAADLAGAVPSVRGILCHASPPAGATGFAGYEAALAAAGAAPPDVAVGWDDLCSLRYTGGTTGRPKGVLLTHQAEVLSSMNILLEECPVEPSDVFLHLQPLSHGGGAFIPPAVLRGARNLVPPSFDPGEVLALIEERGVTIVKLVPTMLLRLLHHPDFARRDLTSLRRIVYGASSMPAAPLRAAVRALGPILVQGYGQTEVPTTITWLGTEDHDLDRNPRAEARLASAGRPFATVRVGIVDDDGRRLPPGEVGEIVVQSPHQMLGYWNNDAATAETVVDGWVRTGDIGRLDDDGYVYILDRKGDLIVTGGYNVYPREVEDVLYAHPAVAEAAAFGVDHPDWIEAVHAAVVPKPGERLTDADLLEHCAGRLSGYKRPKVIHVVDALPKSAAGKILRRQVKQLVGADAPEAAVGAP